MPNISKDARYIPLVLGSKSIDSPTYHCYVAGLASGKEWYGPPEIRQRHPAKAIVAFAHFDAPRNSIDPAEIHRSAEKMESSLQDFREVRPVNAVLQVKNMLCRPTEWIAEFRIRKLPSCLFNRSTEQRGKLSSYRPSPARPHAKIYLLRAQMPYRPYGAAGLHRYTTDPVRSDSITAMVAKLVSTTSASGTGGPVFPTTAAMKASSSA
jgi:hypothetical protein